MSANNNFRFLLCEAFHRIRDVQSTDEWIVTIELADILQHGKSTTRVADLFHQCLSFKHKSIMSDNQQN